MPLHLPENGEGIHPFNRKRITETPEVYLGIRRRTTSGRTVTNTGSLFHTKTLFETLIRNSATTVPITVSLLTAIGALASCIERSLCRTSRHRGVR